jgi:hypothetical protein
MMFKLLEVIIGIVLIYVGLDRVSDDNRVMSILFGVVALVGLVLTVHGILLYNVPDFFKPAM